jgi:hypothetical protein
MKPASHGKLRSIMHNSKLILPFLLAGLGLAGCQIPSSGPIRSLAIPAPAPVDPAVGDPCTEAAMAKYFIGPERVTLLGASAQGGSTAVRMKADVRDALCLVSAKGKVISLTDTTPKSANQIAAEEAAAAAKEAGTAEPAPVVEPVKKKAKKKVVKTAAKPAKATTAAPAKKS